ncbi:MAG: amino acid amidase, partial [Lysobacterales bacterium]
MKIFITADIEGITGATNWGETDQKNEYFAELRAQMTAEVSAACEGALAAGATEIWVKDAHGWACNLISSKLPREVQLVRGWSGHPFAMMQELDKTFDAALVIGYHSHAGSSGSPLAHTMTGNMTYFKINGQYASEFMVSAYTAGLVDVPVVFLSGDVELCQDAQRFIPGLSTMPVQRGAGSSTTSIHPHLAVERIRSGVETALKADVSKCRVSMPEHFSVELRYRKHA